MKLIPRCTVYPMRGAALKMHRHRGCTRTRIESTMINCRIRSLAAAVLALASSPALAMSGAPMLPSERSIGTL